MDFDMIRPEDLSWVSKFSGLLFSAISIFI